MNPLLISGVVLMLVSIAVSRLLHERGYRQLTPEEKLRLMDGFSATRAYSIIPLMIGLGVYWVLSNQPGINQRALGTGFVVAFAAYIVLRLYFNYRKIVALEMPPHYRSAYVSSQGIALAGVAWLTATLLMYR